jgi:hypothetical protein
VRPTSGDLVVTRLTTLRWVAAATPELARSLGTVRSFADLPWVGWIAVVRVEPCEAAHDEDPQRAHDGTLAVKLAGR